MNVVTQMLSPERLVIVRGLATSLAATFGAYGAFKLLHFFYYQWTSPLRDLPGPPNDSMFFGNMKQIWGASVSLYHQDASLLDSV
jgi:hypothetical protein